MIVSKALFKSLGGFDESLATGEDYEFCVRAKNCGVGLRESDELGVTHRGVPRNLYEFRLERSGMAVQILSPFEAFWPLDLRWLP